MAFMSLLQEKLLPVLVRPQTSRQSGKVAGGGGHSRLRLHKHAAGRGPP